MGKQRLPLLRWRGIAGGVSRESRIAGIITMAILSVAMVGTQLSYVSLCGVHAILVLGPITSCALLYGPLVALAVGMLAGLAELVHSQLLPLDYYERYFAVPWNSVVLFGLVGLLMGLLYAWAKQHKSADSRRHMAGLVFCCLMGSVFFTLFFQLSTSIINALLAVELPHDLLRQLTGSREVFLQMMVDFCFMALLTLMADESVSRQVGSGAEPTIRETFQRWLAVVMSVAYMLSASFAYTAVSVACRGDAERQLEGQLDYLSDQLSARDHMVEGIARRSTLTQRVLDEASASSMSTVADGFVLGEDGIALVAQDGVIVSSNDGAFVDKDFEKVVGAGLLNGFDESLYSNTHSSEWDMGGGNLGYMRVTQMGYARVAQMGKYQIMVAMSSADVYHYRPYIMLGASLVFLIIFVAVYAQASLLLENVVVRGFDATNDALSRITGGDLNQVVDVHGSIEFTNLSGGINATVGALKDSIAETKAGFERELMTAKAIQRSALPSTFPPFPQVSRFDIYASMDAAREVGGDFYDFFLIDDHTVGFLVADVSGKGIPAALFMMAAKTEVGNYMQSGMNLATAIETVNYHLCQGNEAGMFVTVWAATLDYQTGDLTYVNAGHNPPLLRHEGRWHWLRERGGLFLGTFDVARYKSQTIRLVEGDELLLYTDGVTEAFSVDEKVYGEDRLERFLQGRTKDHPHALTDGLRADIAVWSAGAEQSDDITIVALEYGVAPEVRGSIEVTAVIDNLELVTAHVNAELGKRLCPIDVQNKVDVALEELFVNVCNYAYAHRAKPGNVRVDYIYNASPNAITVQLTDWGVPFDPLSRKDPTRPASIQEATIGGLGILMAKKSVDEMVYMRDGDSNVVAIRKTW